MHINAAGDLLQSLRCIKPAAPMWAIRCARNAPYAVIDSSCPWPSAFPSSPRIPSASAGAATSTARWTRCNAAMARWRHHIRRSCSATTGWSGAWRQAGRAMWCRPLTVKWLESVHPQGTGPKPKAATGRGCRLRQGARGSSPPASLWHCVESCMEIQYRFLPNRAAPCTRPCDTTTTPSQTASRDGFVACGLGSESPPPQARSPTERPGDSPN
jgi:hypothetical protein